MKREIKFRVWDGEELRDVDLYWFEETMIRRIPGTTPFGESYEVMQYTGLKDSKGKEIYEGDILLVRDTKWTVAWHRHENGMTGWMVQDNKLHHWYVIDESILRGEIIGNIYEKSYHH